MRPTQPAPGHEGWAPVMELSWAEALEEATAREGDREAFLFEGEGWSAALRFSEWRAASVRVAAGLSACGVGFGDRVAVLSPGSALWPIVQIACSRLGAIVVPVNVRYRLDELSYVLQRASPRVVFTVERIRDIVFPDLLAAASGGELSQPTVVVEHPASCLTDASPGRQTSVPERLTPAIRRVGLPAFLAQSEDLAVPGLAGRADDPVLLQFTSGTTAFPKAAVLSSRATLGATFHLSERMGVTGNDRFYSTQPFYHVGGSVATTLPPLTHGTQMVVPERYRAEASGELVRQHRCTARVGQAAMYAMELARSDFDPYDYLTLRRGWAAGTTRLKQLIVERMGMDLVISTYGLTETAGTATAASCDDSVEIRLSTCGRALPGVEVAISKGGQAPAVVADTTGEICVRGWQVMLGYFEDPSATAKAIDPEGWLHTGDLGFLDRAGNLHFVDRIKDMIKPGGENVSAAEVERVIGELPAVAQVAVVGMPDDRLGEVPVAFVERRPGTVLDEEELLGHCRQQMASFKVPRRVFFDPVWPLTESGKIQKHVLRSHLRSDGDSLVGKSG